MQSGSKSHEIDFPFYKFQFLEIDSLKPSLKN